MKRARWRWYAKRTFDTLHYEGPAVLLWRMVCTGMAPLGDLGMLILCKKDLTGTLPAAQTPVDLTIVQATEADLETLTALKSQQYGPRRPIEDNRDIIARRFQRGCKCFVGKIGTEIVHYNWLFFHAEALVPGRVLHMRDDEALCDDAFTVSRWRGKAIHTVVHRHMLSFLQGSGYRTAYTIIGVQNKSSMKTHHRLHWEFSGTFLCFTPRHADQAWVWRLKGSLEPFMGSPMSDSEA